MTYRPFAWRYCRPWPRGPWVSYVSLRSFFASPKRFYKFPSTKCKWRWEWTKNSKSPKSCWTSDSPWIGRSIGPEARSARPRKIANLIDWLSDWWKNRLKNWLIDWLIDWLAWIERESGNRRLGHLSLSHFPLIFLILVSFLSFSPSHEELSEVIERIHKRKERGEWAESTVWPSDTFYLSVEKRAFIEKERGRRWEIRKWKQFWVLGGFFEARWSWWFHGKREVLGICQ